MYSDCTQPASTYSKLTIKALEQGVKYVLNLTKKTPERRQWHCSGVFIVNFEHTPHLVLVFLLLTLNMNCRLGRETSNLQVYGLQKGGVFSEDSLPYL